MDYPRYIHMNNVTTTLFIMLPAPQRIDNFSFHCCHNTRWLPEESATHHMRVYTTATICDIRTVPNMLTTATQCNRPTITDYYLYTNHYLQH